MTKNHPRIGRCGLLLTLCLGVAHAAPSTSAFPIHGIDVSHHQGQINWHEISPQKIQFVYIKASEGGDYLDDKFQDNWLAAREQGLLVGAYHVFRLCRDGQLQAENFIRTVPIKSDSLAPVMDLEYDSVCLKSLQKDKLLKQIKVMHDRLQQHYGKAPIFYTTPNFYHMILMGNFSNTPIWIRDYQSQEQPQLKDRPWLLWQHSNQGKVTGISTEVDLNVFRGSSQDWKNFLKIQHINQHKTPTP